MQGGDLDVKMRRPMLLLLIAGLTVLPLLARAQLLADSGDSPSTPVLPSAGTAYPPLALTYTRPTEKAAVQGISSENKTSFRDCWHEEPGTSQPGTEWSTSRTEEYAVRHG
jgi:hypothetical protein